MSDKLGLLFSTFAKLKCDGRWKPLGIICDSCLIVQQFDRIQIFIPGYRIVVTEGLLTDNISCCVTPDLPDGYEIRRYIAKFVDIAQDELENRVYIWDTSGDYADIISGINENCIKKHT